jgi:hypothetical protein
MGDWKERLRAEDKELGERIGRLNDFKKSDEWYHLMERDQFLLAHQLQLMKAYRSVLSYRVLNLN